jgi:hypothetical protein
MPKVYLVRRAEYCAYLRLELYELIGFHLAEL